MVGAPALQPDPVRRARPASRTAAHLGERPVRLLLVAQRAERVDVAVDPVAAQRHAGPVRPSVRPLAAVTGAPSPRGRRPSVAQDCRPRPRTAGRSAAPRAGWSRRGTAAAGSALPDHLVAAHELDQEPEHAVRRDVPNNFVEDNTLFVSVSSFQYKRYDSSKIFHLFFRNFISSG